MLPGIAIALIAVIVVVSVLGLRERSVRGRSLLERWAAEQRFEIVESRLCVFFRGPFLLVGYGSAVYRVTVRGESGMLRHGFVRCGSLWHGVWRNNYEVKAVWDGAMS